MSEQIKKISEEIDKKGKRLYRNQLRNSGIKIPTGRIRKELNTIPLKNDSIASKMIILDRS